MSILNTLKGVMGNLLGSEKAIACGLLVAGATVLCAIGKITVEQWMSYTQVLAAIYVGGKAIQGAGAAIGAAKVKKTALPLPAPLPDPPGTGA